MVNYVYTIHAREKFNLPEIKKLKIRKKNIEKVIENPVAIDKSELPVMIAIGTFSKTLSLCVAYRIVKEGIRIITFYPAEKGRYEPKIL